MGLLTHVCPLCKTVHKKESTPEPDQVCYPCEVKVANLEIFDRLYKDVITLRRRYIQEISSMIQKSKKIHQAVIGYWECELSPVKKCVYDVDNDEACDECIYCHMPEERK